MFAPAEMSEVDIFVFENDIEEVAQTVARLGVLHLLDVNTLGKWAQEVGTEWVGRVSTYTTQERRVLELLNQLGIEKTPRSCEGRLDPAEDLASIEEELHQVEEQTHDLRDRQEVLSQQLERWELLGQSMGTLAPLSVSISDLREFQHLHLVAGTIPSENLARLEASLFRIPYTIIPVHHYRGRVLIFAFSAQEHAAILDRALESAFLDPLTLPEEFEGTAQEVLDQIQRNRQETETELAKLREEKQIMSENLAPQLLSLWTRIRRDRAISDAMAHFGHRGRVYLIAGWVPKNRVDEVRLAVEEVTEGRVTFEENSPYAPGERVQVPTLLRHSRLLKPVEGLVSTYGTPGYRELDPTPLVAITFILMFGVMFGDFGHGLVLALFGTVLTLRLIPQLANLADLGIILIFAGLSSSLFGLLFGSVFGMEGVIPQLWINPLDDILILLGASIVFGVILLNIGFAFRLATAARQGNYKEAIFDRNGVAGLLLYWSLLGMVVSIATGNGLPIWLVGIALLLMLTLFLAEPLTRLIEGKRPLAEGNLPELAVQYFFELFEALISYLSNTLSYVRLGAFAVAHVGLSLVVFLLADMVGQGSPVLRLLIIIGGNLFIIGFEGLIVAIQTLRLEYYELFGKFFKGEGIPFKPLTLPAMECEIPD